MRGAPAKSDAMTLICETLQRRLGRCFSIRRGEQTSLGCSRRRAPVRRARPSANANRQSATDANRLLRPVRLQRTLQQQLRAPTAHLANVCPALLIACVCTYTAPQSRPLILAPAVTPVHLDAPWFRLRAPPRVRSPISNSPRQLTRPSPPPCPASHLQLPNLIPGHRYHTGPD